MGGDGGGEVGGYGVAGANDVDGAANRESGEMGDGAIGGGGEDSVLSEGDEAILAVAFGQG